jgi:hypothetical protein
MLARRLGTDTIDTMKFLVRTAIANAAKQTVERIQQKADVKIRLRIGLYMTTIS